VEIEITDDGCFSGSFVVTYSYSPIIKHF